MAQNRYVNTGIWVDSYFARLGANEKLAFLYLLTTSHANISGVYKLPLRCAAFESGLAAKLFAAALERFEADGKIVRHGEWLGLVNFIKHQKPNPKVRIGIASELGKAPREIIERLPLTVAAAQIGFDRLSHSNPNLNAKENLNPKRSLFTSLSTGNPQEEPTRLRARRTGEGREEEGAGW